MKKIFTLLFSIISLLSYSQANKNITFRSHYSFPSPVKLANIGGFAKNGREYALVGTTQGLTIFDVTNPDTCVKLFDIPGKPSPWREVKTWGDYAYVTTEAQGGGIVIVDMSNLPGSAPYKTYVPIDLPNDTLRNCHSLHIDKGYMYLYGTNIGNRGAVFISLADPWNPVLAGKFDKTPYPNWYVHDGYVRNDTMWACHIYAGYFSVVDVSNKANPVLLATQDSPMRTTHNSWLSDNGKTLFVTDETDSSFLAAYDIRDVNNIKLLDKHRTEPNDGSIVHNTHILNDYAVNSWYTDGVVIVDGSRPDNLIRVGNYDTSPSYTGGGYHGCWGVYPFLPSGNLVASDIEGGLFVLSPKYVRGCYLEGLTADSISGNPLNDVLVQIIGSGISRNSNITGIYKTGVADSGTYNVRYSKSGYAARILNGVKLKNGILTTRNVKLLKLTVGLSTVPEAGPQMDVFPNPFKESGSLRYAIEGNSDDYRLLVTDVMGRTLYTVALRNSKGTVELGSSLAPGLYFVRITDGKAYSGTYKIVKE